MSYASDTPFPPESPEAVPNRRHFLTRASGVAAAVAVPGLCLAAAGEARAAVKRKALPPPVIPVLHPAAALIREIKTDEDDHVVILQNLLNDEDNPLNPKIRKPPVLKNLVQPNLQAFLTAAAAFENTGSATYGGALFAIQQTPEYFPIAVGLTTIEARHAGYLNALLGQFLYQDALPVESPKPQQDALAAVEAFIANLNGPVPSFDPVNASDANNFRILDFLLLLEYVESAFYNVNVPRFVR